MMLAFSVGNFHSDCRSPRCVVSPLNNHYYYWPFYT